MVVRASVLVPLVTAVAGTAVVGVLVSVQEPERAAAPRAPGNVLAPPTPGPSAFAWRLVDATSAERMMVLEVETARPGEAVAIAQQLTEPYKDRYDEVLVFFFEPNANPRLALRRVQWTRAQGYRTLELQRQP